MLTKLLDFIWPRACEICERPVDRPGRYLCSDCMMRLPFIPTDGLCRCCGRDAAATKGEFLCEECISTPPNFDRARSVLHFDEEARKLLLDFKFEQHIWLRDDFVDMLEGGIRTWFNTTHIDLVVAMPTTLLHRFDRGYNQCTFLAKSLAKRLALPYGNFVLRRVGHPKRQGGLNEEDRRTNIIGTIAVMRPNLVRDKTVLVIDDVMTTGSTLSECARVLKLAGTKRVWAMTLTRSVRYR